MHTSLELYRKVFTIRACEEYIIEHYHEDEMKTPMHMSMGGEAIAAGVLQAVGERAQTFCSYRTHAIYLARTDDIEGFFGELYGKVSGPNQGKAGSMHIANPAKGHYLSSGIVATQIPVAVGAAYANKMLGNGKIAVVFFGDGATNEGAFWESLNLACLLTLPILFVCEDNGLAVHTPAGQRSGYQDVKRIISKFNIQVTYAAGHDAGLVHAATQTAMRKLPAFLYTTYHRWLEHVGVNEDYDAGYREKPSNLGDPVGVQRQHASFATSRSEVEAIEREIRQRILNASIAAKNASFPQASTLLKGVYSGNIR